MELLADRDPEETRKPGRLGTYHPIGGTLARQSVGAEEGGGAKSAAGGGRPA